MSTDASLDTVEETLTFLASAPTDDPQTFTTVRAAWERIIGADPEQLTGLYDRWFATISRLLGRPVQGGLDGVAGYAFVLAFSSGRWLQRSRPLAWALLADRDAEHRELLTDALTCPDDPITDAHLRTRTGTWSDIPAAMIELYVQHAPFTGEADQAQGEIAQLVPEFFRAYPDQPCSGAIGLLKRHPDPVAATAEVIRHQLLEAGAPAHGPLEALPLDMLGAHADVDDQRHRRAEAIVTAVLADVDDWPESVVTEFLQRFVSYPLGLDDPVRHRAALRQINTMPATRKALTAMVKALPAAHRQQPQELLDEAAAARSRPKALPIPPRTDNRFADLGLKLLVIEELMYRQQVLQPRFDLHTFAAEHDKRQISVEREGHQQIPEVKKWFGNLGIGDDLLARVETLHQSSGLDGGPEFLRQLHPFWDPGQGDEPIKITNKAIGDLELLPNLTRISGLENSRPSKKLLSALAERGIELIDEESAEEG
ncbi:DUF6892 domain-containing protein [Propionibacteriaceae bacterium Y1700]|uniref:DUF6892 domain-containing protein n=1 Tax=Microlunatus sp. Y1700 TaxID=3418487 RepID=UPI003DA723DF